MTAAQKKRKAGDIELLRFVFALTILFCHTRNLRGSLDWIPFGGGALAVEFFFIVSGYLLAASALKNNYPPLVDVGQETVLFTKKKLSSFYPEFLISWCIAFLVTVIAKDYTLKEIVKFGASCVWELLLLLQTGLRVGTVNSVTWYLSAMLICMMVLYPLLRKYPDVAQNIIVPLVCVFLFGYLLREHKTLRNPSKWLGFAYKGLLRAMAELCLGIMVYRAVQWLKKWKLTTLGKLLLSVVKWSCYIIFLWYLTKTDCDQRDYFFTLLIAVAIGISFSGMSLDTGLFDNPVCMFLGRYSLSVYLSHNFWSYQLPSFLPASFPENLLLPGYITISLLTALVVMQSGRLLRQVWPRIADAVGNHLILQDNIKESEETFSN